MKWDFEDDVSLIFLTDQLSAAVREIFKERGYDVEVGIGVHKDGGMVFKMDPKGSKLTQEIVDSVLNEAAIRIGSKKDQK